MTVKYFAYFRHFTGVPQEEFPSCADVCALLHALADKYGPKLREKILSPDGNGLGSDLILMINGRGVEHLGGFEAKLSPEDTVALFPVVAGG